MSSNIVRRGYLESDKKKFNEKSMEKLREAQKDIFMLINRNYPIKNVSVFVGNHYLLTERQRLALVRATSSKEAIEMRSKKEIKCSLEDRTVYIDGFNIIITLEVALSNSTIIRCMDGTIRDLAGLRGTYRIIDKTDMAINLIGEKLEELKVRKAVFYLDEPVSNSGRLKMKILDMLAEYDYDVEAELVRNADKELENMENVISSDAVVLDKSISWFNMAGQIIEKEIRKDMCVNLSTV